jgi:putative glutamine amidotransferase
VHPSQYGGEPSHPEILHDPERDATTLPLIREAVRRELPILAICRGIQELNVALGGTLHQRVHEVPGRLNHRSRKDSPDGPYGPAHSVALTPGGLLALLAGTAEVMVNSLHSQGIDRPAPRLRVEAMAPDGQIEAVSLLGARFVVGVQWHPEYKVLENPLSKALFSAFADACDASVAGSNSTVRAA